MVDAGIPLNLSSARVAAIVTREATKLQDCGDIKPQRIRQSHHAQAIGTNLGSLRESLFLEHINFSMLKKPNQDTSEQPIW